MLEYEKLFKHETMAIIYQIRNSKKGKAYVGCTKNIGTRINQHINRCQSTDDLSMYADMREDITAFSFSILEVVEDKDRFKREAFWIEKLREETELYNQDYSAIKGLSPDQVIEVKRMLSNTTFTIKSIARITGVPLTSVYDINRGKVYIDKNAEYPLRYDLRKQRFFTPEQVTEICLKLQTDVSIKTICNEYGYKGEAVLRKINDGTYSIKPSQTFSYPIRPIKGRKNKV